MIRTQTPGAKRDTKISVMPTKTPYRAIRNRLLAWYEREGRGFPWRHQQQSEFEIVITESLLQQTRAETVAARRDGFFNKFPDWESLRAARTEEIEEALKPFGLWRRRASSFKRLAIAMREHGDKLPSRREQIEALPGIGQYIANAIELMVFGRPRPLLDVNMARVLGRLGSARSKADLRHDPTLQRAARDLIGRKHARETGFACLDLAGLICISTQPRCSKCPVKSYCNYYCSGRNSSATARD